MLAVDAGVSMSNGSVGFSRLEV
uniref:Uncharacterized protein n=1 Tax=Arundo donax TaxID=35708 RepID=A0A0A9A5L8_ARUDO